MPKKLLLVIGHTWPEPASTAAGNRMLQLLHFFLERAYRIVFASTASETELSMDLSTLEIEKKGIQLNDSSFDGFVQRLNPDIVLFDRFLMEEQFGWRVAEFAPSALRILDTEDLHSLRQTRLTEFKKDSKFSTTAWLQSDMAKREIASIYRCDLSLIVSTYEMRLLTEVAKIDAALVLHLPFMLDPVKKAAQQNWPPFEARQDFMCIGNGKHRPNVDAIIWLKKEIWPIIRKELPETNLLVHGAYLPQQVKQLHDPKEGFLIKGWVDNATASMLSAKVNLAPLRFGAGIKGKLIQAIQTGTPSVTTSIGAEGMHNDLPWSGTIADTADAFAKAAIELYANQKEWYKAQQNGITIVNNLYRKEILGDRFNTKIKGLRQNLVKHRIENFIGAMLQYQTMQSTKYLSKWIEAKNA